jgi:endonuclease YncB( thermonuclease family)
MRYRFPIVILLLSAGPALAAKPHYEIVGEVVAIADGDTLTILDQSKTQHKIRLAGTRPRKDRLSVQTRARISPQKVFRKTVRVNVIDVDRYHREVGRIYFGDRFINMEMVRDGFAWRYVRYDKAGEFTDA